MAYARGSLRGLQSLQPQPPDLDDAGQETPFAADQSGNEGVDPALQPFQSRAIAMRPAQQHFAGPMNPMPHIAQTNPMQGNWRRWFDMLMQSAGGRDIRMAGGRSAPGSNQLRGFRSGVLK